MTEILTELLDRLSQIEHGFKHVQEAGDALLQRPDVPALATALLKDPRYQARMLAVHLLGRISSDNPQAMEVLRTVVAKDSDWRVQEMLAKALDQYGKDTGYEQALPLFREWLASEEPNRKRAVVEGLRIWTSRPYFRDHPDVAVAMIGAHHADPSEYLRKSVGNALRDIRRKFPELVDAEVARWDTQNPLTHLTRKLVEKSG
ncbi:HEAT repeat domain-containing protein [Siphonobacter aquaeclarae]|uniref:DNA alkylation repair enzyme n=1 Tax=Siphonobacter aquaeclarae TaxID=563176 RepID=A0A1G9Y1R9_9BACT|nr:HEAT repeat domain-containing protein [Siphonobacter aquaeclarae]SDN03024.1 DNA alkylation repair enzyme [Siphonobacter aquaeclarae]